MAIRNGRLLLQFGADWPMPAKSGLKSSLMEVTF
jgi:hypothetical protein